MRRIWILKRRRKVCRKLDAEGIKFEINTDHGGLCDYERDEICRFSGRGMAKQIFEKKYKIRKILCFSKDTEKIKKT